MSAGLHVLYRFYNRYSELMYVGITANPPQRFRSHRDGQLWWQSVTEIRLAHYPGRKELKDAEREAINTEGPLFNVSGAGRGAREEMASDRFIDEMFAAVAATGITDAREAIPEYRRRKAATA